MSVQLGVVCPRARRRQVDLNAAGVLHWLCSGVGSACGAMVLSIHSLYREMIV